jgi:hypothetical protein
MESGNTHGTKRPEVDKAQPRRRRQKCADRPTDVGRSAFLKLLQGSRRPPASLEDEGLPAAAEATGLDFWRSPPTIVQQAALKN